MKKIISTALIAGLLASSLALTASAANNGPKDTDPNGQYFMSGIRLIETDGTGMFRYEYDEETGYEKIVGETKIYGEEGTKNMKGVSYDKATNTLTLNNINKPDNALMLTAMGDDFKINVVGDCTLGDVTSYASSWGGSITFTGSGKLTLNKDKIFDFGIYIAAYGTACNVKFDKGVKLDISGKRDVAYVTYTKADNPNKVFEFNGEASTTATVKQCYETENERNIGYYVDQTNTPDWLGSKAVCKTDPDGMYIMGDSETTDSEGNKKKGHWINKLVYSKALGLYVKAAFADGKTTKYIYPEDEDFNDYENVEGTYYNEKKRFVDCWNFDKMVDSNGKEYAYGSVYDGSDGSETTCVVTYSVIPDVPGVNLFAVVKSGEEAEKFAATLTKASDNWYDNMIDGIIVKELTSDNDHLGVRVINSADKNGIYFMTHGERYENYGTPEEKSIPTRWIKKYIYLDKIEAYIQDRSFGNDDDGQLVMNYDDFDKSGFTLAGGEDDHQYNKGRVSRVNGTVYTDANGKEYVVGDVRIDGNYKYVAFNKEVIDGLKEDGEPVYLLTIAEGVELADLKINSKEVEQKGFYNGIIEGEHFTYDGGKADTTTPVVTPKTTVKLASTKATLYVKQTAKIKTTVKNGVGNTTFKSNNKKVAKVNAKGVVTAVKQGTAKITVANNGVKKTFTVTVKNPKLNKNKLTLKKGKSFTLKITGKVGTAKFTTNKKAVATVNAKGKITAKKKGNAVITVKTNGLTFKVKVTVK